MKRGKNVISLFLLKGMEKKHLKFLLYIKPLVVAS